MAKHLVLVAGNIGAGKTSLTEMIGDKLGWKTSYEPVADNPYLPDFYQDMKEWSFHLQVYFLGHRAKQHQEAAQSKKSAILDRTIYEDFYIFSRALKEMGNFDQRDYFAYETVFHQMIRGLPKPDLLIYLSCPVSSLMERIRMRGRNMESSISRDYLQLLESFYNEWVRDFDACPVLQIPSDNLDFVHKPAHMEIVLSKIQEKLAGKEEVIFPE